MSKIIKIKKRSFMRRFYAINLFGIIITCEKLSKESLFRTQVILEITLATIYNRCMTIIGFTELESVN